MVLLPIMGSKVCGICILSSLQRKQVDSFGVCVFTHNMLYGVHVVATIDWVVSKLTDNGKWSVQPADYFCTGTLVSLEHLDEDFRCRCSMFLGTGIGRAVPFSRYALSPIIDVLVPVPSKTSQVSFYHKTDQFPWLIRVLSWKFLTLKGWWLCRNGTFHSTPKSAPPTTPTVPYAR